MYKYNHGAWGAWHGTACKAIECENEQEPQEVFYINNNVNTNGMFLTLKERRGDKCSFILLDRPKRRIRCKENRLFNKYRCAPKSTSAENRIS